MKGVLSFSPLFVLAIGIHEHVETTYIGCEQLGLEHPLKDLQNKK